MNYEADITTEPEIVPIRPILRPYSMLMVDYRLMTLSVGFDAAKDDPLGVLAETEAEFLAAVRCITRAVLPKAVIYEACCLWKALPSDRVACLDDLEQRGWSLQRLKG